MSTNDRVSGLSFFPSFLICIFKSQVFFNSKRGNVLEFTSLVPWQNTKMCVPDVLGKGYSCTLLCLFICRYLRAALLNLATEYEDVEEVRTNTAKALQLFDGWLNHGIS